MGTPAATMRTQAATANKENLADINSTLDRMMDMANMQKENFRMTVKSDDDETKIPIHKVVSDHSVVHCKVAKDSKEIEKFVNELAKDVASGSFLKGITHTLEFGIKAVIGNSSGSKSEYTTSTVLVGRLGGICRLDYHLFSYHFESSTAIKAMQNLLCVTVILSSVKLDKDLTPNDLKVILENSYPGLSMEHLLEMENKMKKTYNAINQGPSSPRYE